MTVPGVHRLEATPYPRLSLLIVGGVVILAAAGALYVGGSVLPGTYDALAVRLFVVGYLLALFGGAGYVALLVGHRIPES